MSCHTDVSTPTAPSANASVAATESSMPSIPWKLADRALTDATGPVQYSMMSRSWIECSSSVPEPALSRSPRHVEP